MNIVTSLKYISDEIENVEVPIIPDRKGKYFKPNKGKSWLDVKREGHIHNCNT